MYGEERNAAQRLMTNVHETECFLLGDIDESEIPLLKEHGLIIERVEEVGAVHHSPSLLQGLLVCGKCGCRMHVRYGGPKAMHTYTYDLVGNVVDLEDRTHNCGIAEAGYERDRLLRTFSYDALYRLVRADGRACANIGAPRPIEDFKRCGSDWGQGKPPIPNQDN